MLVLSSQLLCMIYICFKNALVSFFAQPQTSARLYCSVECQRLSWPQHRLNCAQEVPPRVERSETLPRCVNLDLDTVLEQLNLAMQIMDKSDMDEASCSEVWKAIAVLEHLINVLRPFTDVPVYLQEIEEGVYFANVPLATSWPKFLCLLRKLQDTLEKTSA